MNRFSYIWDKQLESQELANEVFGNKNACTPEGTPEEREAFQASEIGSDGAPQLGEPAAITAAVAATTTCNAGAPLMGEPAVVAAAYGEVAEAPYGRLQAIQVEIHSIQWQGPGGLRS